MVLLIFYWLCTEILAFCVGMGMAFARLKVIYRDTGECPVCTRCAPRALRPEVK